VTKVLLIGKDGRTDCLAEALNAGGAALFVMCDYRNPGLRKKALKFQQGKTDDPSQVIAFARQTKPDLVVIGPEEPLAAGVVDALQETIGIPCVGPSKELARLESSKSFTRRLLTEFQIAGNIEYQVFSSMDGLENYLLRLGQFVIKPDGLTGGKGVKVFGDHLRSIEEATEYARELLCAGRPVVVEEKLEGEEFSLQSFCDGETVVDTIPIQDHKRAWEDDTGPNTGGMGSYSCEDHSLPFLKPEDIEAASSINTAVAKALKEKTGQPYRGVLYGGFMLTSKGVRLLEYNARMGDPEAMNVCSLLEGNFLTICEQIVSGSLRTDSVRFKERATVCKYVVPKNYPAAPVRGVPIDMEFVPDPSENLRIYFAAVEQEDSGRLLLTGSRAVAFVGIGESVEAAETIAERAAQRVSGPVDHRRDIGTMKLLQKRVQHMKALSR
jgi:phosphoribosylamine---glycine ligase